MQYNDFNKKMRFSSFFPYGYISPLALETTLYCPESVPVFVEYDPVMSMEERERRCQNEHINRLARLRVMEMYGYAEVVVRKYGDHGYEYIRLFRLTQAGFNLITGLVDDDVESRRLAAAYKTKSRKMSNTTYLPSDEEVMEELRELNNLIRKDEATTADQQLAKRILKDLIQEDYLTPLSINLPIAATVNITRSIKGYALYRGWREMNVNALFTANNFLTQRDRRPLRNYRPIVDIRNDEWLSNIHDYAFATLDEWYKNNPESYLFNKPLDAPDNWLSHEWAITPAFYGRSELPGFATKPTAETMDDAKDNDTRYQTFTGLAIGIRTTYVVYHTRPLRTPWSPSVEENSIKAIKQVLDDELEEYNVPGAERDIKNAIMICPTIQQFGALFDNERKRKKRNITLTTQFGNPYFSLCIVPVNHAGVMQIRALMLSSPYEFESIVINDIMKLNNFVKTPDKTYKLALNGIPVLVAHAMNFQQLYDAWEDYNKGKDFYVSCYPEQAKFIRKIMPNVKFL